MLPDHLEEARRRPAPQLEVVVVDDEVHAPAEVAQPPAQERGELLGLLERVQGQALEVDENEVVIRVVVNTFVESER